MKDRLIELIQEAYDGNFKRSSVSIANHLLANGVIVMPCKVGDKIYKIWSCGKHGKAIAEFEITHIDIDNYPKIEVSFCKPNSKAIYKCYFAKASDFGKTVFLTKEEAEKELAERSKENDRK